MERSLLITEVDDSTYEEQVFQSRKAVVLIFITDWLGSAKILYSIIERLAEEYNKTYFFFSIDADKCPDSVSHFGVKDLPSTFICQEGEVVEHFTGVKNVNTIKAMLDGIIQK